MLLCVTCHIVCVVSGGLLSCSLHSLLVNICLRKCFFFFFFYETFLEVLLIQVNKEALLK